MHYNDYVYNMVRVHMITTRKRKNILLSLLLLLLLLITRPPLGTILGNPIGGRYWFFSPAMFPVLIPTTRPRRRRRRRPWYILLYIFTVYTVVVGRYLRDRRYIPTTVATAETLIENNGRRRRRCNSSVT